jgi:hypothetical protein
VLTYGDSRHLVGALCCFLGQRAQNLCAAQKSVNGARNGPLDHPLARSYRFTFVVRGGGSMGRTGAAILFAWPASHLCVGLAQPADEFYRSKQIRIVVGSTAGGVTMWARLLARHMTRHICSEHHRRKHAGRGYVGRDQPRVHRAARRTVIGMPSRSMPAAAVMKVANVRFDPVIQLDRQSRSIIESSSSTMHRRLSSRPTVQARIDRRCDRHAQGITVGLTC